jgi:hypothetical protein
MLVSLTGYHSFSGEVEASNTPTIRRLTPSCRQQLSPITLQATERNQQRKRLGPECPHKHLERYRSPGDLPRYERVR